MEKQGNYLYKDLTYEIIGCAYDAFKQIGVGFDEIRYHRIFDQCLKSKGLNPQYKVPINLYYRNEIIANFEIDEIVDGKVIVELKCLHTDFIPENYAQLLTYLKSCKLRLGLLINFGLHKVYQKRIIFDEQRKNYIEKWDHGYFYDPIIKNVIDSTLESIRRVDDEMGVAFHDKVYKSALSVEFRLNAIPYNDRVTINTVNSNLQFRPFEIDYWLIQDTLLLAILAGKDKPRTYDIFRMRSYLKYLKIHHGLIAYWSTRNLQLYGIYEQY